LHGQHACISGKLVAMLKALPKNNEYVFGGGPVSNRRMVFNASRKKASKKLQNSRLLRIHFHTLRHWKATTLHHKTKDVLYVKRFLGHRNIDSTLLYVQIADTIFKETMDEFTVKVAKTASEIKSLLEMGFEYVCEKDGLIFLGKRK
jgi:integrase